MTTPITTTTALEALPEKTPIRDRHGDVGIVQAGKVHYPETARQTFERTIKKYGPLTVLPGKTEEEALQPIRDALGGHPTCDVHPADGIACGWKRAVADVQAALTLADEEAGK